METKEDLRREVPNKPNKKLKLVVDIPISVNDMYYYKSSKLNKKAQNYVRNTKAKVMEFIDDQKYEMEKPFVWQYLDIIVYMPDRRVRDSHNMIKLLMDTLEGVIFENDYCIMPRFQSVELDRDNPRLEMVLSNQTKAHRRNAIKSMG